MCYIITIESTLDVYSALGVESNPQHVQGIRILNQSWTCECVRKLNRTLYMYSVLECKINPGLVQHYTILCITIIINVESTLDVHSIIGC